MIKKFNRLLSKITSDRIFEEISEHRSGMYSKVQENSSTEPMYKSPGKVEFRKGSNGYHSLFLYISIAFGVWWISIFGITLFKNELIPYMGNLYSLHPIVIFLTYLPSIAGLIIYYRIGGIRAVKNIILKLIPRKEDLFLFPIIFIGAILLFLFLRYGSLMLGLEVPKITYSVTQMISKALMILVEETALLGGVFGWVGYLLPFLQAKTKNNILSGLLTGLIFGLWVLPMPFLLGMKVNVSYIFYLIQLMTFFVSISYLFNFTKGTLTFYLFAFWLVAIGSHIQLYYFNTTIQLMEIVFFVATAMIIHLLFKKADIEPKLQVYSDFAYF